MDLNKQARKHLEEVMLPFWKALMDEKHGGYFGLVNFDLQVDRKASKGMILNSRILWFFSSCARILQDESCRLYADHAYEFLKNHGMDRTNGGVYWSLNYDGTCKEDYKYTYNQAFSIYGLSAYYELTGKKEALDLAFAIFDTIEKKCKDEFGYGEAFYKDFTSMPNENLSENGVVADKTMNTLLHLIEAYTQLFKVSKEQKVRICIEEQLSYFTSKVYNKKLHRQEVFFDKKWNSIANIHSYGHDIETSWLMDEATNVLGDTKLKEAIGQITKKLVDTVMENAYHEHSLYNESEDGVKDTKRVWWVQAETVVGFLNAYQKFPKQKKYYDAAKDTFQYIMKNMVDSRVGSEWFSEIRNNKEPIKKDMVNAWKCPYHNGRMCLEIIERNVHMPCNEKATKEAIQLLQYLQKIRGNGILTGQHTQTKPMEEVQFIYKKTGKYPALCGFELLGYSPNAERILLDEEAKTEVEENKGTLEEAMEWGMQKKGIVTFTWHWFSPLYGKNKSFYTKNTKFDATKILKKGTAERKAFYADMEYMANELKAFQKNKIPILWRPFHESYGEWFWWGAKGNLVAKELYLLMYEYFVKECGLNHLLWVWNSHIKEAYPGDAYVDVVSTDVYIETPKETDYQKELLELQNNTSKDKVAGLAECGVLPDIVKLEKKKTDWAYYMVWSKEFVLTEDYSSFDKLKAMYEHPYAITLDKLPKE